MCAGGRATELYGVNSRGRSCLRGDTCCFSSRHEASLSVSARERGNIATVRYRLSWMSPTPRTATLTGRRPALLTSGVRSAPTRAALPAWPFQRTNVCFLHACIHCQVPSHSQVDTRNWSANCPRTAEHCLGRPFPNFIGAHSPFCSQTSVCCSE